MRAAEDLAYGVEDLNAKVRAFITGWNGRAHPFTWTKAADQVLRTANRNHITRRALRAHIKHIELFAYSVV
jgi:hypothetical protein